MVILVQVHEVLLPQHQTLQFFYDTSMRYYNMGMAHNAYLHQRVLAF